MAGRCLHIRPRRRLANLFSTTPPRTKCQLTHESPWDVRSAGAYGARRVRGRRPLKSLDIATGQISSIPILSRCSRTRPGPAGRTRSEHHVHLAVAQRQNGCSSPRAAIVQRAGEGRSVRNLTATSGVREADALWSKDGQRVAYLSDEGGHRRSSSATPRSHAAIRHRWGPWVTSRSSAGRRTSAHRLSGQSLAAVCPRSQRRRGDAGRLEPETRSLQSGFSRMASGSHTPSKARTTHQGEIASLRR